MDNIKFTGEAIAGLVTQGVLMMLIPVILLIVWKKKTRESIVPVLVGAAVWFLFAIILKIAPAYFLLQADNPVAKAINGSVWLTYAVAGALAGVFEETGRFIAYKTVLKKYAHRRASVSYGVGHGGFESVYVGFQVISIAVIGILISAGAAQFLTAGADEATAAMITSQFGTYANVSFAECMLGVFERLSAITAHISFSVLVFAAAREKRMLYLYPLTVLLHALFDFSIVIYGAGFVPVWGMELLLAAFAAALAGLAHRVYGTLPEGAKEKAEDGAVSE